MISAADERAAGMLRDFLTRVALGPLAQAAGRPAGQLPGHGELLCMRPRSLALAAAVLLAVIAPLASTAPAAAQDPGSDYCLTTDAPPPDAPPTPIAFGITPLSAGSAGVNQLEPVPRDPEQDLAALRGLRPPGKSLVMRLNRMFWADGEEGVQRYAALVDAYAAAGFTSELQVRYHPPEGAEGDMDAWEEYVRLAARVLGERRSVTALSITNEANFTASPNTSDGAYDGVREAIVRGTVAARDELDRIGRHDVKLGFSFAWRWAPNSDKGFWDELGRLATPEFLAAVDYVGLQIYPHLVWPPAPLPDRTITDEIVEPLTLLRQCYLPKAGLQDVDLWITENGYATNLGRTEQSQDDALRETVEALHRWSGTLGVTDYRWFNLRDNRTGGPDLFDSVGLLRDDYSRKPAYDSFRALLGAYGTPAVAAGPGRGAAPPQPERPQAPPSAAEGSLPATGPALPAALGATVVLLAALTLRRRGAPHELCR